jgi:hypothetical protein
MQPPRPPKLPPELFSTSRKKAREVEAAAAVVE